jgi:hypothetical protein
VTAGRFTAKTVTCVGYFRPLPGGVRPSPKYFSLR